MSQRLADEDFVSPSRDLGISSDREEERSIQPALDGDAGGLFGSEEEVEGSASRKSDLKRRNTPDEEPPSGDDEDQRAFQDDSENEETQERARTILDAGIGRHAIPKPSYGDLHLLQFPNSLGIDPRRFHHADFQPPTADHHSLDILSANFSPYQTSNNTIRWRYSLKSPAALLSNSRMLRWSDGSITFQLASNPREQFEITTKPLAPPHSTVLNSSESAASRRRSTSGVTPYDSRLDSHTYLIAPHEQASLVRITNHITSSLAVRSSSEQDDDALIKLQESLAAAAKGNRGTTDGGLEIISISEDPELAKKKAEAAEKEKLRAQRRRQQQEERERDRANRVLGRSGLRNGGHGAGLTIGGLEDDDGISSTRGKMTKPKMKSRRRNSEYSDDEEYFRGKGRTREDEYDEDDGFLVGSDEEPEIMADESDEEAETADDLDGDTEYPSAGGPKRVTALESGDEGATEVRGKRRRVIEDEDED